MTSQHQSRPEYPLTLLSNFGGNQKWQSRRYEPTSEQEVLDILATCGPETVRPLGSGHSWSDIAANADVTLDLHRLNQVETYEKNGNRFARAGAGCVLQDLLDRLHSISDQTLPTLGVIKRQKIAGAISTGTHGSGRQSLSHFVTRVRVAAFDPATGKPALFDYESGDELRAARCGLGCMGVILSVDLATVPKYDVAETIRDHADLQQILATYDEWPLTQFVLFPYCWRWIAYQRKRHDGAAPSGRVKRQLVRIYNVLTTDIFFHLGVIASRRLGNGWVKSFLRLAPNLIVKDVERVDEAEHVLTLGHHYFRHEEMELTVTQSRLPHAARLAQAIVAWFAGASDRIPGDIESELQAVGLFEELRSKRGSYVLHYPIFFRRIMPEDTLVSMASSAQEPCNSISFFTYDPPEQLAPYYELCSLLARAMNRLCEARPHWGKHSPLQYAEIAPLYPEMEKFRQLCARTDPKGVFRNLYTERVLNLSK
jgi:FAD/FMN-containing dehydrogenase